MKERRPSSSSKALSRLARSALLVALLTAAPASESWAENVDPDGDNSQLVWAENLGWINAEPSGDGGPGVQVDDFELTGWMWGENVGWISLSCKNTSSCDTTSYGIVNDGVGVLSGFAWSENAGWVNFAPTGSGVTIDPTTGDFGGRAWSENSGWLTFASTGVHPHKVKTAWNCSPAPAPPAAAPDLAVGKSGNDVATLSWSAPAGATGYDVVRGDLQGLLGSGGDFSAATTDCLKDNGTSTALDVAGDPPPGSGVWFLVRALNCGGAGSYDTGQASQVDPRDAGISASGNACP